MKAFSEQQVLHPYPLFGRASDKHLCHLFAQRVEEEQEETLDLERK